MKKLFLMLLLFWGILFSCSTKNVNIQFEISPSIEIELEEYSEAYDFSSWIKVYRDDEVVPYENLKIRLKEGTIPQIGECNFLVIYQEMEKEYKEEFTVTFKKSYSNLQIHYGSNVSNYEIKNGQALESLNLPEIYKIFEESYEVKGYFLDSSYSIPFASTSPILTDLEIYAKLTYNSIFDLKAVDPIDVSKEMDAYLEKLMETTIDYRPSWNKEGFKGRWNYIDGVFLNSIVNLYQETNNIEYRNFFINYINYYIDADGNFINPETGEKTGYRSGELDSVCESRILFDALEMTKDLRYQIAIQKTYSELRQMPLAKGTENFSHKESYLNQIWLDGMYMYAPFLARYANRMEDKEIFSLIQRQYAYIRTHMFDEDKKLYYHGHDTTKSIFWANSSTGNSKSFWLRSNGWFLVSLVDVIEYFPEGESKAYLIDILKEALEGIMQYKDEKTHMFYQLVDQGATAFLVQKEYLDSLGNSFYGAYDTTIKNYLESSGSSMIAYVAMKASRLGYVSKEYESIGKNIFEGIYSHSYRDNCLNDICITAGLGPEKSLYRDGTFAYYLAEPVGNNDAKGVGPFLMAYIEYAKINQLFKQKYTIHQIYLDRKRDMIFEDEIMAKDIVWSYIPGYIFEGFYYDKDFIYRILENTKFTQDVTIYCKYIPEKSFYETLLESDRKILEEDFNSYSLEDALPEFKEWGTKGIYYHINDKNNSGIDLDKNHIQLGEQDAYLFDNSEYDGTQLIIDAGNITEGIIKGYMEVTLENAGNQWTFFQMYGTRMDGTFGEIFGARFESGILQYRINGASVQFPNDPYISPREVKYLIEYVYDMNTNLLTVKMNGKYLVLEHSLTATSFGGIKIVTSDGLVHYTDEEGVIQYCHRRARVDNIILVVE